MERIERKDLATKIREAALRADTKQKSVFSVASVANRLFAVSHARVSRFESLEHL